VAATPRDLRNNNPGNIERNATKWQGMADDQSSDKRFVVFKSPQFGIRAMARILLTYEQRYGCDTIRKIISRWAPPSENNTAVYVAEVAAACGVKPDDVIDIDTVVVMLPLVRAIIRKESGLAQPYSDDVILEGLHMAGVSDAPSKPVTKTGSFQAQVASGVAIAGAGAAQVAGQAASYAPSVANAAHKLSDFTGSPLISHLVTILLTIAGGLTAVGLVADFLKHKSV
jgi:hypothetical protein